MKTLYFEDYEDFACNIADKYDEINGFDDLDSVDVVAKYYEAKEIIAELVAMGYGIAFMTDFADPEWDGYEDEFVISLHDDEIWCEPAKRNGEYIHPEAKVVYLLDNCNSKIVPMIEADETYEVEVGDDDDCDGECENCECNKNESYVNVSEDEDGNQHGFTASKSDGNSYVSYSYYTTEDLSNDDIHKMLKAFGF